MNNKLLHTLSILLLAMVAFTFAACSDEDEMGEAAGIVGKWRDGNKTLLFEKNGNFSSEIETTPVQQRTGTYSYNPTLGNIVINTSESSREIYNIQTLNATTLVLLYTDGDVEGFYTRVTGEKIDVPSVTTTEATNVSFTTATVGGEVTSDGGLIVTERGVVYSTSPKPTTADTKLVSGKGKGSFSVKLSNLKEATTYYARAYAVNSKGTSYGEQKSFTTGKTDVPNVTTTEVTDVSFATATVSGEVTSDGGLIVTERGVVYGTSPNPTTADTKSVSGKGKGSYSVALSNLQEATTYYVRAYAVNSKGTSYGEQKSFTTKNSSDPAYYHGYVDLGLSVKWATCNVGADSPEDYGDYFAWGETEPKSTYNWSAYKWCQGDSDNLTKYCTHSYYGTVDNKTQLDLSDDAAHVNWGGAWRMPTHDELTELIEGCSWTWTTQNGVNGYKVTSKTNGNSIFLPAAGARDDSSLYNAGTYGYYWSSSLNTDYPGRAGAVCFFSSLVEQSSDYPRYYGFSVRSVCP